MTPFSEEFNPLVWMTIALTAWTQSSFSVEIQARQSFSRNSVSIDPVTGERAGVNVPDLWSVDLPTWPAWTGLRRIAGANYVVGLDRNGRLFGTPNLPGKAALQVSADNGQSWRLRATLPQKSPKDHVERITSLCCGTNEILFASMNEGGLYMSLNGFADFRGDLVPEAYRSLAPRAAFNGNLLIEQVLGRAPEDCRVLACLYGQRLEGAAKSGCIQVWRTDLALAQMMKGVAPRLQLVWAQDPADYYARHLPGYNAGMRIPGGSGMHLHTAAWAPLSGNGESNVLFVSFGDKESGHVCRIPNFDRLRPCLEGAAPGWNYSDAQVFAVGHQPTGMWTDGGKLYFLARDYDGATLVTPDSDFEPQMVFCDSFMPYNSPYAGVNYDVWVGRRAAIVASLVERAAGQYGVLIGDPAGPRQMFRFIRGFNPGASQTYAGFSAVLGNPQSGNVVVRGDWFGGGALSNTWLISPPALERIQTVLAANGATNLIANAAFAGTNGVTPSGWHLAWGNGRRVGGVERRRCLRRGQLLADNADKPRRPRAIQPGNDAIQFSPGQPLCVSFAYRFPAFHPSNSPGVSLRVDWRDERQTIRMDSSPGLQCATAGQWHTANFRAVPPANAIPGALQHSVPRLHWRGGPGAALLVLGTLRRAVR